MRRVIQHHFFYPIILLILCLIICFCNYTPHTFLTGWDTLHPEFNFSTNFSRLISGVWRFDQGLGTVAAHSHMSDLPRVLFLYLIHFVTPLSFLRYAYIFLCLITGTLSSFYLIKYLFHKKEFAFIGALFYLFNLSTLQQFIVPFEMFCTQFAFLPLILLFTLQFLHFFSRRYLLLLSLVTLLATPQAYAAHLWYAFFIIYLSFLFIYFILNFNHKTFKKILIIFLTTIILNSFWLFPNLFYIKNSSQSAKDYKYNRINSQEFLLKNRETGNLVDSSIQKGFYFNWEIFNFSTQKSENLMIPWAKFTSTLEYQIIAYLIFVCSFIGLIISFIKKDKAFLPFAAFFIIPFIFLNNRVPPFSFLFDLLIKNSTFEEAFRFIFNKLTTPYQIGIVVYFIYFLNYIFTHRFVFSRQIFAVISLLIIFTGLPYFQGQLIHPYLRQNIPQKYFDFYQFFNQQAPGRTLTLPIHQPTGWQYYRWGYQGSGFVWFGAPNSFLDRDSDRWSTQNDNSYQEIYNALYSNDQQRFFQVCQKYQIKYILWDQDNISTATKNADQITFKNEIDNLINKLDTLHLLKQIYNQNNLILYQINTDSLLSTQDIHHNILPVFNSQPNDFAYQNFSDYTSIPNSDSLFFPFRNLITRSTSQINTTNLPLTFTDNQWRIPLSISDNNQQIYFPNLQLTNFEIAANLVVTPTDKDLIFYFDLPLPSEIKNQINSTFIFPKNSKIVEFLFNNYSLNFDSNLLQTQNLGIFPIFTQEKNTLNGQSLYFGFDQITNPPKISVISSPGLNFYSADIIKNTHADGVTHINNTISLSSRNSTNGFTLPLNNLPHSFSYILAIKAQHVSGIPARFCLKNYYSNLCSLEDEISQNKQEQWNYFLIPNLDSNYDYGLEINSISQDKHLSQSLISQVSIIPFPYQYLSQIYIHPSMLEIKDNSPKQNLTFKQTGTFFYKINSSQILNQQIILSQAYDSHWLAFYFKNGTPHFLKHILINNWANGWVSPDVKSPIYIIFWPQILEFIGFIFIPITFIWISKFKNKTNLYLQK